MRNLWGKLGCLALVGVWLLGNQAFAREFSSQVVVYSVEDLYDLEQTGDLSSEEVDVLVSFFEQPININRADRYLLYELPGVSLAMADVLIAKRSELGSLVALTDLEGLEGYDAETLRSIEPFVYFGQGDGEDDFDAGSPIRGKARIGSLWRVGLPINRDPALIDEVAERAFGPQSYIRATAEGFNYFGAGLLLTLKTQTFANWDFSKGYLSTEGPQYGPELDGAYFYWDSGPYSIVAGTYMVGFGERLVFDRTVLRDPDGWYAFAEQREDNETGRLKNRNRLLGVAIGIEGADVAGGWIDATLFGSYQPRDLYQFDFNYGPDEFASGQTCDTSSDCPDGFSCNQEVGECRSSRLYDANDESTRYLFVTYSNAYREAVFGANLTFNFNENSHVGATAYGSYLDFDIAEPGSPAFNYGEPWPNNQLFGAVGLDGRTKFKSWFLSGEYAFTFNDANSRALNQTTNGLGHAAFLRARWTPAKWGEFELSSHYYSPHYENPFGRGFANPDTDQGSRQRNEAGMRLLANVRPHKNLRLLLEINTYFNPYVAVLGQEFVEYLPANAPVSELLEARAKFRIAWDMTRKESLRFELRYTSTSDLEGPEEGTVIQDFEGRGVGLTPSIGVRTQRIPKTSVFLNLSAFTVSNTYVVSTIDGRRVPNVGGDGLQELRPRVRLQVRTKAWESGTITGAVAMIWQLDPQTGAYISRRRNDPFIQWNLQLEQRLGEYFWLKARGGMLRYDTNDPIVGDNFGDQDRYDWYGIFKASLEARW